MRLLSCFVVAGVAWIAAHSSARAQLPPGPDPTVDLLFVYTDAARLSIEAGGDFVTSIDLAVGSVNDTLAASGARARVRRVGLERLTSVTHGDTPTAALARLRGGGVPEMPGLRAMTGADVVVALQPGGSGECFAVAGLSRYDLRDADAYIATENVCGLRTAMLRLFGIGTFPGAPDAVRPYGHGAIGYTADTALATLMASESCGSECLPVDRLSSPALVSGGVRLGDAATADSVRAVDEAALFVSSYGGCAYDVTAPASVSVPAAGGVFAFTIQTDSSCASGVPDVGGTWLTTSVPDTLRRGATTVTLSVPPNLRREPRETTAWIGKQPVTFAQAGASSECTTAEVRPSEVALGGQEADATFEYRAAEGCELVSESWITFPEGEPQLVRAATGLFGQGDAWVVATRPFGVNPGSAPRTMDVVLSGAPLRVVQAGRACVPLVSMGVPTVSAAGGELTLPLVMPDACGWSVESLPPWATLVSPGAGTAPARPIVQVQAHDGSPRTGDVVVRTTEGLFTAALLQAGPACSATLTTSAVSFPAGGGSATVGVSFTAADDTCPWAIGGLPAWASASPATGTGPATITFTAEGHAGARREALLAVAGRLVSVVQNATPCEVTMDAGSAVPAAGGIRAVQVTARADCPWSFASVAPDFVRPTYTWPSGSGNGRFAVRVDANGGFERTYEFGGASPLLRQEGPLGAWPVEDCAAGTLSESALDGGWHAVVLTVHVRQPCPWAVTVSERWLRPLRSSGTGSATVVVFVAPNAGGTSRTAQLRLNGQAFPITQAPLFACRYDAPLFRAPVGGGRSEVPMAATPGCTWAVPSEAPAPWLTLVDPGRVYAGPARFTIDTQPNTSGVARQLVLEIAGQELAISQDPDPACNLTFVPEALTLPSAGGEFDVLFTMAGLCPWKTAVAAPWLTTIGATDGVGPGRVRVRAHASAFELRRYGFVHVNGQPFTVSQEPYVPSAPSRQYLAEGATGAFFDTTIALYNPYLVPVSATLTFLQSGSAPIAHTVEVPAGLPLDVRPRDLPGLGSAEFSVTVDSDRPLAVARTMDWAGGVGSHAETAVPVPGTTWYLAEGATLGGFNLFYLLQNPTDRDAHIVVSYLRGEGLPTLEKAYVVPARSRQNIWVDVEQFDTGGQMAPLLAQAEVSGVIQSVNDVPIIVERAMYLDRPGRPFIGGHNSAGITAPALQWYLAEGATGPFFDLFVLIANPTQDWARVTVEYLRVAGAPLTKTYEVAPRSRFNIWVDEEVFSGAGKALADAAVSMVLTSANGVPIVVERAMWWPGGGDGWYEAHNSRGATTTGTRWAVADGRRDPDAGLETYVLVANTSDHDARIRATFTHENGFTAITHVSMSPKSRSNLRIPLPDGVRLRYGALVESLPLDDGRVAELVVERATYSDAGGVRWSAGNNALATLLPEQ